MGRVNVTSWACETMLRSTRLQISKMTVEMTVDVLRVVCAHQSSSPLDTPFSQSMHACQNSNETIAQRSK